MLSRGATRRSKVLQYEGGRGKRAPHPVLTPPLLFVYLLPSFKLLRRLLQRLPPIPHRSVPPPTQLHRNDHTPRRQLTNRPRRYLKQLRHLLPSHVLLILAIAGTFRVGLRIAVHLHGHRG